MKENILKRIGKAYFLPPKIQKRLKNFIEKNEISDSGFEILMMFLDFHENQFKANLQNNISEDKLNDFTFFSKNLLNKVSKSKEEREKKMDLKKVDDLLNNL